MPRLFLHIGAHKTGTTSIQSFLASNAAFLEEHGFIYPRICWYFYAQHRLAFALKGAMDPEAGDKPQLETELSTLQQILSGAQGDVIISSEVLFGLPVAKLRPLRAALEGYDVRIIASIRRQDNLMASIYNQQTKNNWNQQRRPIAFYLDDPRSFARDLDLYGCLSNWAELFGQDKMSTYCFEAGDAVPLFLGSVGLPIPESAISAARLNEAVPAKALELARMMKVIAKSSKVENLDSVLQYVVLNAAQNLFAGTGETLLTTAERSRVLRHFEADNEKLFATFLGSENLYREEIWSAEFRKSGLEPAEPLTRKDVVRVLVAVAEMIAQMDTPSKPSL